MGHFKTQIFRVLVTVTILIPYVANQVPSSTSPVQEDDYPAPDYYSDNFNNYYDNSPVTSYANEDTYGNSGVAEHTQLPQGNQEPLYSNYEDFPYDETENKGYNFNGGRGDYPVQSQGGKGVPKYQYSNATSSILNTQAEESIVPHVNENFPKEHLPFTPLLNQLSNVNQAQEYEHPYKYSQAYDDGDAGLTMGYFDKALSDKKGIYTVVVSVIAIYLLAALILKTPKDLFEPKCENWGWDGFPEYSFQAEPRFVPALPVDPEMQKEFLELFRGNMDDNHSKEKGKRKGKGKGQGNGKGQSQGKGQGTFSSQGKAQGQGTSLQQESGQRQGGNQVYGKGQGTSLIQGNGQGQGGNKGYGQNQGGKQGKGQDQSKGKKKKNEDDSSSSDSSSSEEEDSSFEMQFGTDISYIAEMCPKDAFFYGMSPPHIEAYTALQRMFVAQNSPADVLKLAKALKSHPKINPKIWYLGLLAAAIERPDMTGFAIAHPLDAMPDNFIPAHLIEYWEMEDKDSRALIKDVSNKNKGDKDNNYSNKHNGKGKHKGTKGKKGKDKKKCIVVDGSIGVENGIENKLWYWREDMMLNQHHLYWHQVYPVNATRHGDRRAELFFFMHRNMLARYNAERLSNGFERTYELELEYGTLLLEGYNSYLGDVNSGKYWTPRLPLTPLADAIHIHDPDFARNIIIKEIQDLYRKFVKAIKKGKMLTPGGFLAIDHHKGITPLANTVEASQLSINPMYYDAFGLHNYGHLLIALSTDPEFKKQLPTGIMSDAAVSMRDPTFYTYHTVIDNLFEKYKQMLAPYRPVGGEFPLLWKGVEIVDVELIPIGGGSSNELKTFYGKRKFKLAPGVDGSVDKGDHETICAVHLDHEPFQFKIVVDRKPCAKSKSEKSTVRIFMAPRNNEHGDRLPLVEQRRLMFQLDAFQAEVKVGRNVILRRSQDNSLTHPWTKSLKEMEEGPDYTGAADFCGCGWPSHLFIPKGTEEGMAFDLFVMVTNYDEDFVIDDPRDLETPETCNSPYIFCGIPRRLYPDARPMGYPFDRPPFHVPHSDCGHGYGLSNILCKFLPHKKLRPVATLEEYVASAPNMAAISFGIKHIDKLIKKPKG